MSEQCIFTGQLYIYFPGSGIQAAIGMVIFGDLHTVRLTDNNICKFTAPRVDHCQHFNIRVQVALDSLCVESKLSFRRNKGSIGHIHKARCIQGQS